MVALIGQAFIDSQAGVERRNEWNGAIYILRDVWVLDETRAEGFRLDRCEYAVKGADGRKVWKPCVEGVEYADIEWFEVSPSLGRASSTVRLHSAVLNSPTQAASPTLHLRWKDGVLEQMWTVTHYEAGRSHGSSLEWRTVPSNGRKEGMSTVTIFPGVTPLPFDADVMLDAAKRANLKSVVIIGEMEDGKEFFSSSISAGPETLWMLERAKHKLMKVCDDE